MFQNSEVFERNYQQYCDQIAGIDFIAVKDKLGIASEDDTLFIRFFNRDYRISKTGITDASGNRPDYIVCVILAKYILLCPDIPHHDPEWVSFKDFKRTSHFTNTNFFTSDTEQAIVKNFSGRLDDMSKASDALGGIPYDTGISYDLSRQFNALPRISLLLLFNDDDGEFPAKCTVLFQKHAEFYLDPESLAMTSSLLSRSLAKASTEL